MLVGITEQDSGRKSPTFTASGRSGRLAEIGARALLRLAGLSAPTLARVAGRRYRNVERIAARTALAALGTRIEATGFQHGRRGPYVVLALHESLVDPLLLARLPLRLAYVARDEIWEWPSVGAILEAGNHLTVATETRPQRRTASARELLRDARTRVESGDSLVIFPQGSVLGIEVAFNRGAFWLARALGLPVLPVVITGTHRVWEFPFSPALRRGQPVTLHVLPAVEPTAAYRDRLPIEREMRTLALASTHGPARRFVPSRDGTWDGYPFDIAPEFTDVAAELEALRGELR